MADYRVVPGTLSVAPVKPSYTSDEEVELGIRCSLQRRNGVGALLTWSSDYKVYDHEGKLLAQDSREHTQAPWTEIDTAVDDFTIKLGKFIPGMLVGEVVPSAHG